MCALRKCDVSKWKKISSEEEEVSSKHDLRYLTGLIASKCVSAYYYLALTGEGVRTGGGFHTYPHTVRKLPICRIDFGDPVDRARHERMVGLVEQMLALHEQLAEARISQEKTVIQRQMEATDRQIDRLVYELYRLTEEEIEIVEEAVR